MFSNRISRLNPYVPGEQPKDRVYIKLNANENPYPPSSKVSEAIDNFLSENSKQLGLYPDPDSTELRKAIAAHLNKTSGCMNSCNAGAHGLDFEIVPEMIFCGNGSDEVLSLVFYSFFDSDRPLVAPEFTYSFYPVYCTYYGIPLKRVQLKKDFTLDVQKMLELADENSTGMIFANPNAPTSLSLSTEQIKGMLDSYPRDKVFVVDEAYADFSQESCISLLDEYENLVVVRTFSKSMCFAGMRLGYCVANPSVIEKINTVKNSFNHFPVDKICQTAGIASCKDTDYYIQKTKQVCKTREQFLNFLKENGWQCYPPQANFVLTQKPGMEGKEVYLHIKQDGILVRHFASSGIEDFVRITIGTDEQMKILMESMKKLG